MYIIVNPYAYDTCARNGMLDTEPFKYMNAHLKSIARRETMELLTGRDIWLAETVANVHLFSSLSFIQADSETVFRSIPYVCG